MTGPSSTVVDCLWFVTMTAAVDDAAAHFDRYQPSRNVSPPLSDSCVSPDEDGK